MRHSWCAIAVAVAVLATAVTAEAQYVGRSYRGLFGSGVQGTNHSLSFDSQLGGGFDTNVLTAEPAVPGEPTVLTTSGSTFSTGMAGLTYRLKLSKVNLEARGSGVVSHYSQRVEPIVKTYRGDVNGSVPLWSRARLSSSYSASFQPFYYLPWLAGVFGAEEAQGPAPAIDETAGAIVEYHTNHFASAVITQTVSKRISLSGNYSYQLSDSESNNRDFTSNTASAGMSYMIGKGLGVRIGYGFSDSRYGNNQSYKSRNIDGGLDFNKALSISRKTTVAFSTGMSAVVDRAFTYYRLDAHASLAHELGRSWTANFIYNRDVSFDDAFRVPVPMDSFSAGVNGLFSRRLAFHSSIGSVYGALGFAANNVPANNFETYYARAGLVWAFSRSLGMGTDYTYFQYRFDAPTGLPAGLVRRADRQHVRVFVTYRAMLFKGHNRGS